MVGDAGLLRRAVALLGLGLEVVEIETPAHATGGEGRIEVLAVCALPLDLPFGRIDARAGAAAFAYISRAIDEVQAGRVSAIVTAPINKAAMNAAGIDYPGHTEILAERSHTTGLRDDACE